MGKKGQKWHYLLNFHVLSNRQNLIQCCIGPQQYLQECLKRRFLPFIHLKGEGDTYGNHQMWPNMTKNKKIVIYHRKRE